MTTFQLSQDESAWNMDGSASDKIEGGMSWIQFWSSKSGRSVREVRCSFVGCRRPAEVGGHIWIRGRGSAFVAPICRSCNYSENSNRMQNSNSQLKHHTVVVEVGLTEDMMKAPRRIAVRSCQDCGEDISDRPSNHTLCYECYSHPREACNKRKAPPKNENAAATRGRRCQDCGRDISDRPSNHTLCYGCYMEDDYEDSSDSSDDDDY